MEADRPHAWSHAEMHDRYARLRRGVVAFHARILEVRANIKAAQDEREDLLADLLRGLESDGRPDLLNLVRTMNAARLERRE